MRFLALSSFCWQRDPCSLRCGWSRGFSSAAAGLSLVSLSKGPGFVFRWGEPLDGVGKTGARGGLAGRFSTTSSSRRQCWWWGRIWFISLTDSFYKLCQLSALSASILRLPEQTKTGATEALSGLQTARADRNWCHSGERRLAAGLARGGTST